LAHLVISGPLAGCHWARQAGARANEIRSKTGSKRRGRKRMEVLPGTDVFIEEKVFTEPKERHGGRSLQ
jgi:hypothetical protein